MWFYFSNNMYMYTVVMSNNNCYYRYRYTIRGDSWEVSDSKDSTDLLLMLITNNISRNFNILAFFFSIFAWGWTFFDSYLFSLWVSKADFEHLWSVTNHPVPIYNVHTNIIYSYYAVVYYMTSVYFWEGR